MTKVRSITLYLFLNDLKLIQQRMCDFKGMVKAIFTVAIPFSESFYPNSYWIRDMVKVSDNTMNSKQYCRLGYCNFH